MRRFRFSLRTLLCFALLCGSGVALWRNVQPWQLELRIAQDEFYDARFSHDGKYVFSLRDELSRTIPGKTQCLLEMWDSENGKRLHEFRGGFGNSSGSIVISPQSHWLVLESQELDFHWEKVFDVSGEEIVLPGVQRPEQLHSIQFSSDDRYLVYKCGEGPSLSVRIFDLLQRKLVTASSAWRTLYTARFSPDGKVLAVLTPEKLFIWNCETENTRAELKLNWDYDSLSVSSDKELLAMSNITKNSTLIYSLPKLELMTTLPGVVPWNSRYSRQMPGDPRAPFSPDGRRLLIANAQHSLLASVWDTQRWKKCAEIGPADPWPEWSFSRDSQRVIAASSANFQAWASDSGRSASLQSDDRRAAEFPKFSPDGNRKLRRDLKSLEVWRRIRPEPWWGVAWLAEFWVTVVCAGLFGWSVRREFSTKSGAS
jgi:hypothetical protein